MGKLDAGGEDLVVLGGARVVDRARVVEVGVRPSGGRVCFAVTADASEGAAGTRHRQVTHGSLGAAGGAGAVGQLAG